MKEFVNTNFLTATSLTRQYDTLQQEFISARYGYEMVSKLPKDNNQAKEVANRKAAMEAAEWKVLTLQKVIEETIGVDIPTLRIIVDELNVLIERQIEIEGEIRVRQHLSPVLLTTLEAKENKKEDDVKMINDLKERIAETDALILHKNTLEAKIEEIAGKATWQPVVDHTSRITTF